MEVKMVTKEMMEVFVTQSGKVFKDYEEAVEQDKKERISNLFRGVIANEYFLTDKEYKMFSDFIYDRFESIEEIVNE